MTFVVVKKNIQVVKQITNDDEKRKRIKARLEIGYSSKKTIEKRINKVEK